MSTKLAARLCEHAGEVNEKPAGKKTVAGNSQLDLSFHNTRREGLQKVTKSLFGPD